MTSAESSPVVLAPIVDSRLQAIATQMAETMLRTSRSGIFQSLDFATGIFTADGRWIALKDYAPVLSGAIPPALDTIRARAGDEVRPGDVYVFNDSFTGNNHLPDVTIAKPVFADGELRFWSVTKGHQVDMGGSGTLGYNIHGLDSTTEGVRLPPVRLYREGVIQQDLWDVILANLKLSELVESDLHCQIGAVNVGEQELLHLLDTYGTDETLAAIDHVLESARRHMAAEIAAMPDGVYRAERHIDDGGPHHRAPATYRIEVVIAGEEITFDFSGSDPQIPGFANSTRANTISASLIGLFATIDPDLRMNSGSIAPLTIITEPGTITHAVEPGGTILCTVTSTEAVSECIWLALAQAVPARANAGWSRAFALGTGGINELTGRPFAVFPAAAGGGGATEGCDGWHSIGNPGFMGGGVGVDVEIIEITTPVTILENVFEADSAGSGTWRGGTGSLMRWRAEQDDLAVIVLGGGTDDTTAPFGLAGGGRGRPNRSHIERADGTVEPVIGNSTLDLHRGDIVEVQTSGGGGFGDPLERAPEAVAADVLAGFLTPERAVADYGVVVSPGGIVDPAATDALRGASHAGGPPR